MSQRSISNCDAADDVVDSDGGDDRDVSDGDDNLDDGDVDEDEDEDQEDDELPRGLRANIRSSSLPAPVQRHV